MSVWQRIARVLVVVAAVASGLVLHFWLLLLVSLGCGHDGGDPGATTCNDSFVVDAWFALVAAGEIGMLVAGGLWIAGRDAAAPLAFVWLLTMCVAILPVATAGA